MKAQFAREQQKATATAKAEVEKGKRDAAAQIEKDRKEAAARETSSRVPQRFTTTREPTKSQSLNSIELSEHHILNASSSASLRNYTIDLVRRFEPSDP